MILAALAVMLLTAGFAFAQNATRLRSGVTVKGFVGGEGHESFVIRARKGQSMTVVVTRRVKPGGNFNLTVSRSADFNGNPVRFGRETNTRRQLRWTGRIPATGNYYFYTTAFPEASYRLTVTLK